MSCFLSRDYSVPRHAVGKAHDCAKVFLCVAAQKAFFAVNCPASIGECGFSISFNAKLVVEFTECFFKRGGNMDCAFSVTAIVALS